MRELAVTHTNHDNQPHHHTSHVNRTVAETAANEAETKEALVKTTPPHWGNVTNQEKETADFSAP